MIIDISDHRGSINTSQSYNKDIFVYKEYLIIPYINLEIIENDVFGSFNCYDKLNYSYLIFSEVAYLAWGYIYYNHSRFGRISFDIKEYQEKSLEVDYFMGCDISHEINGCEFKIFSRSLNLFIPKDVKARDENWIPIDTPNFKKNVDKESTEIFFNIKNIPKEIINFCKANNPSDFYILDIFQQISDEESSQIQRKWIE